MLTRHRLQVNWMTQVPTFARLRKSSLQPLYFPIMAMISWRLDLLISLLGLASCSATLATKDP